MPSRRLMMRPPPRWIAAWSSTTPIPARSPIVAGGSRLSALALERMLTRVAEDAERALSAVERTEELLDDERVADAHRLLRELIGQDFDVDEQGVPRLHRGTRSARII